MRLFLNESDKKFCKRGLKIGSQSVLDRRYSFQSYRKILLDYFPFVHTWTHFFNRYFDRLGIYFLYNARNTPLFWFFNKQSFKRNLFRSKNRRLYFYLILNAIDVSFELIRQFLESMRPFAVSFNILNFFEKNPSELWETGWTIEVMIEIWERLLFSH